MIDLDEVMKLVHVIAAIAWIGGGITLTILVQQTRSTGTADEAAALMGRVEWFGKAFFSPLSVLVLLSGLVMAITDNMMAAPWVSIGFLGIFVSAGIGMGYLTPKGRQMKTLIKEHGMDHPDVVAIGNRMMMASRIDIAILLLIVAVMVIKPGA